MNGKILLTGGFTMKIPVTNLTLLLFLGLAGVERVFGNEAVEIKEWTVPWENTRPRDPFVDLQNRPWIAEVGTHKLATVDPKTLKTEEILLPRKAARPRSLGVTSDGHTWYVDYAGGFLGRLNPATGRIQEWPMPGGNSSRPYGMAVDDRDRLWFVECGPKPNRFVGFDPETETFFSITEIGSGGGTIRHMFFHKQNREVWFGTDTNTIGRVRVP
jgi:virginiamycin B lyase